MTDKRKCVSCGKKTRRRCTACGEPLCSSCTHVFSQERGVEHLTPEDRERRAMWASRTSPTQRFDPVMRLPLNLFELMKRKRNRPPISEFYFVEPYMYSSAIVVKCTQCGVITLDPQLLKCVLGYLEPRRVEVKMGYGYVYEMQQVIYPIVEGQAFQELSVLRDILTVERYEEYRDLFGEEAFDWAPTFLGRGINYEEFVELVEGLGEEHYIPSIDLPWWPKEKEEKTRKEGRPFRPGSREDLFAGMTFGN